MNKYIPYTKIPDLEQLQRDFGDSQAFLFDMDGTLFNTEGIHERSLIELGKKFQIKSPWTSEELHREMMGKADHFLFEIIKSWPSFPKDWKLENFIEEKNQILLSICDQLERLAFFPEKMKRLVTEISETNSKLALVTSSEKIITYRLLKIAQIDHFFDLIITRDDVKQHKPHPLPYLVAMETLKVKADDCLIFEDSNVGLEAAKNSGGKIAKAEWFTRP